MGFDPTAEQEAITEASKTNKSGVAQARAGCGKTTMLDQVARARPRTQMGYIAYNKSIATEAQARFPRNVECRTAHSFAFQAVGKKYADRLRGPRVPSWAVAKFLRLYGGLEVAPGLILGPNQQARLALDTVKRFTYSADPKPSLKHVPYIHGSKNFDEIADVIAKYAERIWTDAISANGTMKFEHDHYLKLWAMTEPELPFATLLVDEAQDLNPVLSDVVLKAHNRGQQVIMVGDSAQQIYAWRGAEDAMEKFSGADWKLFLSKSFRFGPAIADEANKWLTALDSLPLVQGHEPVGSKVASIADPDAVLCRTNATSVSEALELQEDGYKVAIVGGTGEIEMFAKAAQELQSGKATNHPELLAFENWQQVVEYVDSGEGQDLKKFVDLINGYGVERVLEIAGATVSEKEADVVVSTAHKAKGREWSAVRIANDFREPEDDKISKAEFQLAYVAVTRGIKRLDPSGVAWIDRVIARKQMDNWLNDLDKIGA